MLYTGGERLRWHRNIRATPLAGISAWGCPIPAHNCRVLLSVATFPSLSCFLQVKNVYECKWFKKFCPDKAAVFQHGLSKYVKGNLSIKCSCALLTLVTGLSVILVGRNLQVCSLPLFRWAIWIFGCIMQFALIGQVQRSERLTAFCCSIFGYVEISWRGRIAQLCYLWCVNSCRSLNKETSTWSLAIFHFSTIRIYTIP